MRLDFKKGSFEDEKRKNFKTLQESQQVWNFCDKTHQQKAGKKNKMLEQRYA